MPHLGLGLPSLDLPIHDHLVLRTVAGAEDLLTGLDTITGIPGLDVLSSTPGRVRCHLDGTLRPLHSLRLFATLAVPLAAPQDLHRSATHGVISALADPVRFRVAPGTANADLLRTAATNLGWSEDPGDWTINLVAGPEGAEAEIGSFHWSQRFGRLERLPWSTKPVVAEVLARLAKLRPGHRVLDPFCGTATLVTAAADAADVVAFGSDHDPVAIALARKNLTRTGVSAELSVASAERLEHADRSIDRVLSNLPFGKLVGSHSGNRQLYPAALREIARVLHPKGRAVLMTDDKRLFEEAVQRTRGLKIVRRRLLAYGGVTPTVYVVTPTGR
jgi:tRNA (guanine6-N2)-methyltransferase